VSLPPGTKLGSYQILAPLGAGGMGEVYRARDAALNRDVAIKTLPDVFAADADRVARLTREAQVLAALNHPNIAGIYGIEHNALVMELVEGDDLAVHIARGPLAWTETKSIARQIADALEAAHEQGIIHRDLKPQNIKVRPDGTVKILDFGLAKAMSPDSNQTLDAMNSPTLTARATQMGMILGTAAYMAPEQARGRPVDRRADIWAFGVVLYEMLTGRRAFEGDDVSITLANVLKEDVRWDALPADLPASVHRLLRRCLERDPKRRLSAIGDARLELDDVTPNVSSAPSSRAASMLPWGVATVAALAAVVFGWLALRPPGAPTTAIWTSIPAPVGQFPRGSSPAVSPDGRMIVFAALDEKGQSHLWLRTLSEQSARRLPGTEDAGGPFWSPDSTSIAFFKDLKLQTMSADGSTPRVIATASGNARGGTWNRDDVIVFIPAPGLGLHRVSASAGGASEPLSAFANQPGTLAMYPTFLPDGQRFLFTSSSDNESWICVGSLADGSTTKILQAYSRAEYAAGFLLFGNQGALYVQPFDPSTIKLSGERTRVLASVGSGLGHHINYGFSASEDGSVIAASNTPFLPLSQLTWFDRSGTPVGRLGEPGHIFGFSVSRDRTRIAVERLDPRANSIDPWITQVNSGFTSPMRAVSEGALASVPTWSHDDNALFFSSGYGTMRVAPVAGGPAKTWAVGAHWPQSASPDGSVVLINQQGASTGGDLMLVSLIGDHTPRPYIQTPFNENGARFSPNGKLVAYVSNASGRREVYLQSFPQLGTARPVSSNGGEYPEWSGDGGELYFTRDEPDGTRTLMVARVTDGRSSTPQRVFGGFLGFWEGNRTGFAVFDNGTRILGSILVPVTAPQVITVGQHWTAGLGKR